jgi:hypothetical protein
MGQKGIDHQIFTAYSPGLNLIEILWRFMKYYWLPRSAYASFHHLCEAVEEILKQFGTTYTIDIIGLNQSCSGFAHRMEGAGDDTGPGGCVNRRQSP